MGAGPARRTDGRRSRRATGTVALAVAAVLAAGVPTIAACTVGQGVGQATGNVCVDQCTVSTAYDGTPCQQPFSLNPDFFAGEPIDGVSPADATNCLVIRLQRQGTRIEVNDVLYIDVRNLQEVARCVRGVVCDANGSNCVADKAIGVDANGVMHQPTWCDWGHTRCCDPADAACLAVDSPCIEMGIDYKVDASLQLLYTCSTPRHSLNVEGEAASDLLGAKADYSWIRFDQLGKIAPDSADQGGIGNDFKVDFGDTLKASFHFSIGDQRLITSIKDMDVLLPTPVIWGSLDGNFNFDLERGRAAQPFP